MARRDRVEGARANVGRRREVGRRRPVDEVEETGAPDHPPRVGPAGDERERRGGALVVEHGFHVCPHRGHVRWHERERIRRSVLVRRGHERVDVDDLERVEAHGLADEAHAGGHARSMEHGGRPASASSSDSPPSHVRSPTAHVALGSALDLGREQLPELVAGHREDDHPAQDEEPTQGDDSGGFT
jgi:hypothetical protein